MGRQMTALAKEDLLILREVYLKASEELLEAIDISYEADQQLREKLERLTD